jgi:hypothetical protein
MQNKLEHLCINNFLLTFPIFYVKQVLHSKAWLLGITRPDKKCNWTLAYLFGASARGTLS